MEAFLHREQDLVAGVRRQGQIRHGILQVEAVADAGRREHFLRAAAEVVAEARQGVVPWIDRPQDLIEGLDRFAGAARHLLVVLAGRFRSRGGFGGQRAEDGDVGEIGADLIVQVAGDPGAFLGQRGFRFQAGQLAGGAAARPEHSAADRQRDQEGSRGPAEPAALPPVLADENRHLMDRGIPHAVAVQGLRFEKVAAGSGAGHLDGHLGRVLPLAEIAGQAPAERGSRGLARLGNVQLQGQAARRRRDLDPAVGPERLAVRRRFHHGGRAGFIDFDLGELRGMGNGTVRRESEVAAAEGPRAKVRPHEIHRPRFRMAAVGPVDAFPNGRRSRRRMLLIQAEQHSAHPIGGSVGIGPVSEVDVVDRHLAPEIDLEVKRGTQGGLVRMGDRGGQAIGEAGRTLLITPVIMEQRVAARDRLMEDDVGGLPGMDRHPELGEGEIVRRPPAQPAFGSPGKLHGKHIETESAGPLSWQLHLDMIHIVRDGAGSLLFEKLEMEPPVIRPTQGAHLRRKTGDFKRLPVSVKRRLLVRGVG